MKNERETIEKVITRLDTQIETKRSELQRLQSGWTEDTYVTGRLRAEVGAMMRERTALAEKLRHMATLEENSGRSPSSSVFFGSSF